MQLMLFVELHLSYRVTFFVSNRREGIVEALKNTDGSSETVVNTLKEYVAMNTTLKSILQKVPLCKVTTLPLKSCCKRKKIHNNVYRDCVVPENICASPKEGFWKFQGRGGWGSKLPEDICSKNLSSKLQKLQNRAARVLTFSNYDCSTSELFQN